MAFLKICYCYGRQSSKAPSMIINTYLIVYIDNFLKIFLESNSDFFKPQVLKAEFHFFMNGVRIVPNETNGLTRSKQVHISPKPNS